MRPRSTKRGLVRCNTLYAVVMLQSWEARLNSRPQACRTALMPPRSFCSPQEFPPVAAKPAYCRAGRKHVRKSGGALVALMALVAAVVPLITGGPAHAASADARRLASLPSTAGPPLLRRRPATAPQLTNGGVWKAEPILVSGAASYRDGEFLYQDYLYDDHGAEGTADDPTNPQNGDNDGNSQPQGSYTYPTTASYHGNAADLVELRVRPGADSTAFRVTLNTLADPSLVAFTISLGSSSMPRPFPNGANVTGPAA